MTIIRASHIFPINSPPIENGAVELSGGKIVGIGPYSEFAGRSPIIDLGNGVLLPTLVNAHTHLEFSWLDAPLGQPGIPFTDWIRLIVAARQDQSQNDKTPKGEIIAEGLSESHQHGVGLLGEIATRPTSLADYLESDANGLPHVTLFMEQLGRREEALPELQQQLNTFLDGFHDEENEDHQAARLRAGASPHAPYSVGDSLLNQILLSSNQHSLPVAMHLAETLEERELLQNLTGPFVDLLKDFGVWDAATFQNRQTISTILQKLGSLSTSLVIHGNYLTESELDLIAARSLNQSIVFCPRTHDYFRHSAYPLDAMQQRGINVALGTDSRASNPDLNLFEDMKMVWSKFPSLEINQVLAMGTLNGAKALNRYDFGRLEVGLPASLAFIRQPAGELNALDQWLFASETSCGPVTWS